MIFLYIIFSDIKIDCVLFAKWIKFSVKKTKTLKTILENWKKNTGKVREFCQSGKMGTLENTKTVLFHNI